MELNKIKYEELNARQKENYNYHKVASKLADYGYDCMRLNNDWQGADFIAVHNDGEKMLKVQLKGRFTINHKYKDKNIYIAFVENNECKIFFHDDAYEYAGHDNTNQSWAERGQHYANTPKRYTPIISIL